MELYVTLFCICKSTVNIFIIFSLNIKKKRNNLKEDKRYKLKKNFY